MRFSWPPSDTVGPSGPNCSQLLPFLLTVPCPYVAWPALLVPSPPGLHPLFPLLSFPPSLLTFIQARRLFFIRCQWQVGHWHPLTSWQACLDRSTHCQAWCSCRCHPNQLSPLRTDKSFLQHALWRWLGPLSSAVLHRFICHWSTSAPTLPSLGQGHIGSAIIAPWWMWAQLRIPTKRRPLEVAS